MIIKMQLRENRTAVGGTAILEENDGRENISVRGLRVSWAFIDNLRDVEVREIGKDAGYIAPDNTFDVYINTFENVAPESRVLITAKRLPSNSDVAIVTDYQAYLLNDNGKTIERLN